MAHEDLALDIGGTTAKCSLIENGEVKPEPIRGTPKPFVRQDGGYLDLIAHPDYAQNGWLYLAFSDPQEKADGAKVSLTKIVRGKLKDGAFIDQQTIFQGKPEHYIKAGGVHFGGRLVFDGKGHLFFPIGDRGTGPNAQNLGVVMGKVHRLNDDGTVPAGSTMPY